MEPLSFLANLLLSVTIGTLMVALIAYMAYKIREVRKPQSRTTDADADAAMQTEMVFLQLYVAPATSATQENDTDTRRCP